LARHVGAISGKFTINANGDQVYFSQGNLQYQASTNTWRFAENQWNYVGGSDYPNHQIGNPNHDIYYWSTTSYHSYNGYNANALVFPTEYPIYQYISYYRWYGCSVRLVSDIVE
jgi:hypothetical protein